MDFLFLITDIIFFDKIEAILINSLVVILQYIMLILPNEYLKGRSRKTRKEKHSYMKSTPPPYINVEKGTKWETLT